MTMLANKLSIEERSPSHNEVGKAMMDEFSLNNSYLTIQELSAIEMANEYWQTEERGLEIYFIK